MAMPAEMPADLHAAINDLCDTEPDDLQLLDVLKVTEVLAASLKDVFSHEDTPIYSSASSMAAYAQRAHTQLKEVYPAALAQEYLPKAQEDLKAIVSQTEVAADQILNVAESMLSLDPSDGTYADAINQSVMAILEACSFQDLTGQRASRIADSLDVTSGQIETLSEVFGAGHDEASGPLPLTGKDQWREDNLLHGPQNGNESISQESVDEAFSQDDIDSLFD